MDNYITETYVFYLSHTHTLSHSLSLSFTLSLTLSLSLSHTLTLSLSLSLSLYRSLSPTLTIFYFLSPASLHLLQLCPWHGACLTPSRDRKNRCWQRHRRFLDRRTWWKFGWMHIRTKEKLKYVPSCILMSQLSVAD